MISVIIFSVVSVFEGKVDSQFKRDENTAEEAQKYNPLTPTVKVTGEVKDHTVNQVLPFEISTESQLVRDEKDCYKKCEKERDQYLKKSASEGERGRAWDDFYKCKEQCPIEAANKAKERQRAPAGSVIDQMKFR